MVIVFGRVRCTRITMEKEKEMKKITKEPNIVGIHIGCSKETVIELRDTILGILNCNTGEATKQAALSALTSGLQIHNATVSGNTVTLARAE